MAVSASNLPPKYALSDWHTSNKLLRSNAERLRDSSHTIRQEARKLTNETDSHTRWTQHDTNTKLEKRIDDINEWREALERCLSETDKEIEQLQIEKQRTEQALEAKKIPLNVAIECLMLRENRKGIDLVRDVVEEQLHKEVEVIEGIKALLQQKVTESFEQLCLLQEARHQIHCDLTDKCHALEIDGKCHELSNDSGDKGFQVNPTRTVKGSVTPETWNAFSQHNKFRGEAEMKASKRLREAIFATLEKTVNDLEAQRRATEYEFRKRIHESEQAKNELEWQQKQTKEEISVMEVDIESLKQAIDNKIAPMQVAQTRLENRTHRQNVELCRDIPQYQLCYEVGEIDGSVRALIEKLKVAESALRSLLKDLARIEHDLAVKNNSLELENACMSTREKLVASGDGNQTDGAVEDLTNGVDNLQTEGETSNEGQGADTLPSAGKVRSPLQASFQAEMDNPYLQSTYNTDFEQSSTQRSSDLQRTMGAREVAFA